MNACLIWDVFQTHFTDMKRSNTEKNTDQMLLILRRKRSILTIFYTNKPRVATNKATNTENRKGG